MPISPCLSTALAPALVLLMSSICVACGFDSQGHGTASALDGAADSATEGDSASDEEDPDAEEASTGSAPVDCDAPSRFFRDADEDGFGDPSDTVEACEAPAGYADNDLDCDDDSAASHPGADEACDGVDNDCDGGIDEFSTVNAQCGSCAWDVGPGQAHAFAHCDEALTWDEARSVCVEFGGDLAVVSTAPLHAFVHQMGEGDRWIGLDDLDQEGRWVWVNGEEAMVGGAVVGFDAWQADQPDDGAAGEDCGLLVENRGWSDVSCEQEHAFACQLPL